MRKLNYNRVNIFLLLGAFLTVSFMTITYAALNTNMMINGSAIVRADNSIRITNLKLIGASNGAIEQYNSKYSADNITVGILFPNKDSTITYNATINNKSNQKYVIKDIVIESTNNENINFVTNYSDNQVIEGNSSKDIEITFNTTVDSETISSIILKFSFAQAYVITFDANGGTLDQLTKIVLEDSTYGELPVPTKENNKFIGWYTKKTDGQRVESTSELAILIDHTLYAKWGSINEYYAYNGNYVFTGSNYVDTGVYLFSEDNIRKNFEVSFEIKSRDTTTNLAVMASAMDETGSPWPGIVYRVKDASSDQFGANASTSTKTERNYKIIDLDKISIKRVNNIIYISFNDGFDTRVIDFSSMLSKPFNVPLTFGAGLDGNRTPFRFFKGTLANMYALLSDDVKTIKYNPNGGTGIANQQYQQFVVGKEKANLIKNTFSKEDYGFIGWNTKPDGTGISYSDQEEINITSDMELYAQWSNITYTVKFDSNGGSGEMENQVFETGESKNLLSNSFTKSGTNFLKWNTRSDGLGKSYYDGEIVKNLTSLVGDTVVLYAQWGESKKYLGDNVFDGTNYIDTGIYLFSETNIRKNFEISFEIKSRTFKSQYDVMISAVDEKGSPWPGIAYRLFSATQDQFVANASNSVKKDSKYTSTSINKVTIKRVNNVIYISTNGESDKVFADFTTMLSKPIDVPLTIGAGLDGNRTPFRYFTGTLSNIEIYLYD